MRNVTAGTLTQAVVRSFDGAADPRFKHLVERLVHHLHAFAREVNLTPEEWKAGIDFLHNSGKISTDERNEFILASDVLGLTSLVDMLGSGNGRTAYSNLGPFYIAGAPWLEVGGDMIGDNEGGQIVFYGRVIDAASRKPVQGAVLDVWQTAANGLYSNQDPGQPDFNLRRRMKTDANGGYAFTTVRPAPYTVPEDGPVGEMLRAADRRPWRPAHYHFSVSAEGSRPLVTEIFHDDDPYIDNDPVFGVREELVVHPVMATGLSGVPYPLAAADRLKRPFYLINYEFYI